MRKALITLLIMLLIITIGLLPFGSDARAADGFDVGATPGQTNTTRGVIILRDGQGGVVAQRQSYRATSDWECKYYTGSAVDTGVYVGNANIGVAEELVVGSPYILICTANGQRVYLDVVTWDPQNPLGPIEAAGRAAELARAEVSAPPPVIATSPPVDGEQLVGLKTWLWLTSPYATVEASATLAGVTATVTAEPIEVTWSPGDAGDPVVCRGAGKAWSKSDPNGTTDCGYVYQRRSTVADANGTFALTATVRYRVTWTSTTGENGTFDPLVATSTVPLLVREAQAVIN